MAVVALTDVYAQLECDGNVLANALKTAIANKQNAVEKTVFDLIGWPATRTTFVEFYPVVPRVALARGDYDLQTAWDMQGGRATAQFRGDRLLDTIILRWQPVRAINSVYENPSWPTNGFPSNTLVDPSNYYLDAGDSSGLSWTKKLVRYGSTWTTYARAVKVSYDAGYSGVELAAAYPDIYNVIVDELVRVAAVAVARARATQAGGAVAYASVTDGAVSYAQNNLDWSAGGGEGQLMASSYRKLQRYINPAKYLGT